MINKLYTPAEVARKLRVTQRTIYDWLRAGRLRAKRAGHFWRISNQDLEQFLGVVKAIEDFWLCVVRLPAVAERAA